MIHLRFSLLHLFVICSCITAMKPEEFEFRRLSQKTDTSQSEPAAFRIDIEIYRHTKNDFSDLRLFNNQGQEVAYLVRYISDDDTETTREIVPLKLLSFKKNSSSEANTVFCRKKNDESPEELSIVTPVYNFEKNVSVLGSNDRKHWEKLATNQLIFDYSQFIDLRNTSVSFDKKDFIYYNVVIDTISTLKQSDISRVLRQPAQKSQTLYTEFLQHQEPFRLNEIRFYSLKKQIRNGSLRMDQHELVIDSTATDTVDNSTIIYLSSGREPVNKVTVYVSETNFYRKVTVLGTNDTTENASWTRLADAELSKVVIDKFKQEHKEIPLNGTYRFLHYKLIIQNRDNAPLTITSAIGSGPRHEIVFFHNGLTNLNVCYKADSSTVPQYDIGTILQNTPAIKGNNWSLETPEKNEHLAGSKRLYLSSKTILTIVLSLMVAILAIILFFAVKKVDSQ